MYYYFEKALHYAKYMEIVDPEQQIKDIVYKGKPEKNKTQNFNNVLNGKVKPTLLFTEAFMKVCKVTYENLKTGKYE